MQFGLFILGGDILYKRRRLISIFIIIAILTLSGCTFPLKDKNEEIPNEQNKEEETALETAPIISPEVKVNEEYYRGVLPYERSSINGMLGDMPNRLDSKYFEMGLIELAKSKYDPSNYIFQEGHVLTMNEIEPLLDTDQFPQYANFIYEITEHNYLKDDGSYGGIVLGVLVSPKYYTKNENGERIINYYTEEELVTKSKQLSNELISLVQRKLPDVPITVGVMRAEVDDPKIPGTFFLEGNTDEDGKSLEWKNTNEYYLFLPAELRLDDANADIVKAFKLFKDEMDLYLPGYAGITGVARVVDGELVEITIKSIAEFDSTSELIQYTQFAISRINKYFPEKTQINYYVYSIDRPKAVYIKQENGKDFMHIYRD